MHHKALKLLKRYLLLSDVDLLVGGEKLKKDIEKFLAKEE